MTTNIAEVKSLFAISDNKIFVRKQSSLSLQTFLFNLKFLSDAIFD